MLDHMQATQRIRASKKFWRVGQTSQIGLDESDIRMPAPPHGPNIHDIKAAKGCNMGDKSVNSATDINMPNWICLMDQLGNEQILVEIVSTGGASVHAMFTEYGVQLANFTPKLQEPAPVTPDLSQVSGSSARRTGGLPKGECVSQTAPRTRGFLHRSHQPEATQCPALLKPDCDSALKVANHSLRSQLDHCNEYASTSRGSHKRGRRSFQNRATP
jgi:hypothetical protein